MMDDWRTIQIPPHKRAVMGLPPIHTAEPPRRAPEAPKGVVRPPEAATPVDQLFLVTDQGTLVSWNPALPSNLDLHAHTTDRARGWVGGSSLDDVGLRSNGTAYLGVGAVPRSDQAALTYDPTSGAFGLTQGD